MLVTDAGPFKSERRRVRERSSRSVMNAISAGDTSTSTVAGPRRGWVIILGVSRCHRQAPNSVLSRRLPLSGSQSNLGSRAPI